MYEVIMYVTGVQTGLKDSLNKHLLNYFFFFMLNNENSQIPQAMLLYVTTQNFKSYRYVFSFAGQTTVLVFCLIIYCHILFSSCFIYESFVSQIT